MVTGLPAVLRTWPSSPGHLIFQSVAASAFVSGATSLARQNTTITSRYGKKARNSRPPERRADSAAGACSTVRVVPPPVPPPSAVSSRSRVPVLAASSTR